jgi:cell division initiation protein
VTVNPGHWVRFMCSWVDRIISEPVWRKSARRLAIGPVMQQDLSNRSGDGFPDPRSSGRKATPMMNSPAARLTAREIIAKTFSAKSRRGYDPAEVDAYLMDVARQVDELNLEIDRLTNEVVRLSFGQPASAPAPAPAPAPVMAEAPPPPPPAPVAPVVSISATEAEEESLKLILKAAQKTAEQTITDARSRADEIIAEARYRSAEITRESDRKSFEAASRAQGELVALEEQLVVRRNELDALARTVDVERGRVRALAHDLLRTVGDEAAPSRPAAPAAPPVALEPPPAAPAQPEPVVLDLTNDEAPATAPSGPGGFRNDFDSFSPFGNES